MVYYVLWFAEWSFSDDRKYLFDEDQLRSCAEQYQFSAEDVLRFGEVEFDDDDGNGVYGGCYRTEEESNNG